MTSVKGSCAVSTEKDSVPQVLNATSLEQALGKAPYETEGDITLFPKGAVGSCRYYRAGEYTTDRLSVGVGYKGVSPLIKDWEKERAAQKGPHAKAIPGVDGFTSETFDTDANNVTRHTGEAVVFQGDQFVRVRVILPSDGADPRAAARKLVIEASRVLFNLKPSSSSGSTSSPVKPSGTP